MRWRGRRQSANVEDRRRMGPGMALGGGGLLVVLVGVLVVQFMGGDPATLLDAISEQGLVGAAGQDGRALTPEEQERAEFVAVVLADTEDVWNDAFQRLGRTYREPRLRLFTRGTGSGCGFASSAVGPFYCPADESVYIDLDFFEELAGFGAPGDFAQAYVIAHEVGHHVQRLLGFADPLERARERGASESVANRLSVRLELQADFLAGVFAHYVAGAGYLERGDVEEALQAANAIGDDRLQEQTQGTVVPDSFTHGTSEQRMAWFSLGYRTGDLDQMDTFDDAHFAEVNRGR